MDKYEYCGSYQLTWKAKQEQKDNKIALKVAEMKIKNTLKVENA